MISFAGGGPNTRGTDLFITFMTGNANGLTPIMSNINYFFLFALVYTLCEGNPGAPWETPFGIINETGLEAVMLSFAS